MKTSGEWRQHLSDLVNARLDAAYSVQWARNPRCLQPGISQRRLGSVQFKNAVPLWTAVQNPR